jgi:hypothetical protein
MPAKTHKGKSRPFAGRKDIEARNLALPDARAVRYYTVQKLLWLILSLI